MKTRERVIKRKSQYAVADEAFKGIAAAAEPLRALLQSFNEILGLAQNGPPEGEADGSISEARWAVFTAVCATLEAFLAAVDRASP